ncbi:hypothetical protein ACFOY2_37385 [Nonomuraea purpurea]|uniref:Tetratricopeptide repeat protein n=1 Tax=Nonomuraea purpurea TaxID=1849276 RepID=A0ABV8GG56_9ACTN
MSSWPERLETAIGMWQRGELDDAAEVLREIVISGEDAVVPEASQLLGHVLQDKGDLQGALAAHRSVIASGHPVFAQRSAISLGLILVDEKRWALAWRPLRLAAGGADADLAVMADIALVRVLRMLGDLDGAAETLGRVRRSGHPEVAELTAGLEEARWPDDGGERERQAWQAYEAVVGLLDSDAGEDEVVLTGLDAMLSQGIPALCSRAAFRLYTIHARRPEFEECRRVMEHAIAVGDPAERGMAEKLLGAALGDLGEKAEARDAYRRAAEDHRPEIRLDALIQESKFTHELGDEEEARALLRRVVESGHPRYALVARACLGQVYAEAGEVEDALDCWRTVLGAESEFHAGAVSSLGTLLHGLPAEDPRRADVIAVLRQASELADPDVAFQAQMTISYAAGAARGPDEEREQAVDDCDAALELIRADDLDQARILLHRVIDAQVVRLSARACAMLATLEYGEGDAEQAQELLEFLADGDDYAESFSAAATLYLFTEEGAPVLDAGAAYQRLGREVGIAALEECVRGPNPAVSALAKSMLAHVYISLGVPRSRVLAMLDEAASAGESMALSHAAVLSWMIRAEDGGEAVGLLRRAFADGHPALAPWVAHAFGKSLEDGGEGGDEVVAAYTAVAESGHPGLVLEAESRLLAILEARRDLPGLAEVHERIMARDDHVRAARSAWLLGATRVRMDDFPSARAAFDQVGADHPELAEDGVFARSLLAHDYAAASAVLSALREPTAHFMTTWLTLEAAHAWERAGEIASADAALSMAIEHGHPEYVQEAALYLGALRNDRGDHAGAAEALAVAAAGDNVRNAMLGAKGLGEMRFKLGDFTGSAAAYRQALAAADPGDHHHEESLASLTQALVAAGQVDEAYDLQVAETGEGPHVHLLIGATLEQTGDLDAAAAHYEQAIQDDPVTAHVMLARLMSRRGEPAQAVELARRGIDSLGDSDERGVALISYELGGFLADAGDEEGARAAYERAAASDDPDIWLPAKERLGTASLNERGIARLREGDRAGALELFTEAYGSAVAAEVHVALYEGEPVRPLLERESSERAGDLVLSAAMEKLDALGADEARDLYELVAEFGTPEQVAIVCDNFGLAYDLAGQTDTAIEVLTRGAAVDHPNALRCLRRLLGVMALQDDNEAMEKAAGRAVDSGDAETVTMGVWTLADVAKARGDLKGAVDGYRAALDGADPDTASGIRIELALTLRQLGETDAAYRTMEAVLTCDDPGRTLLAGMELGIWLSEDERLAEAAEAFGAAAAAGLNHPAPDENDRDLHATALNNLAAVAYQASQRDDHAVAVRALHLAAAGGAHDDAVRFAKEHASDVAQKGDLDAVRAYYTGAAAFPPNGDPSLLLELADVLTSHGARAEARTVLDSLAVSADPHLRLVAATRLLPLLKGTGNRTSGGARPHLDQTPGDHGDTPAMEDSQPQEPERESPSEAIPEETDGGEEADGREEADSGEEVDDGEEADSGEVVLGDVHVSHEDDPDAAVRLDDQAIGIGDEYPTPRARMDLARTLRERGEGLEARVELGRAAAECDDPGARAQAGNLLGKWAFEDGDLEAAAQALGKVAVMEVDRDDPVSELVEMAADNVVAVANRAFTEGAHELAVRALTLAASAGLKEEAVNLAISRARELVEAGDQANALLYVEGASGCLSEPDPHLEIELAGLYAATGLQSEARSRYERLVSHPDTTVHLAAWDGLIPLLSEMGDVQALEDVAQRMMAEPGQAQVMLASAIGMMQNDQGDSAAALRTLRTAAESGEPTALFALGRMLVAEGEHTEARDVLGRVAESEHRLARRALVLIGNTHHDTEPSRAREMYLRVLQSLGEPDPTATVAAKMGLGWLAKDRRDWIDALRWFQQVIDSGEEDDAPLAAAHLGELAYWLGDRGSAVRYYELTLATGTREPELVGEAAFRLGEIRHADGDLELARKHLNRAIESGDNGFAEQARLLLAKL